MAMATISAGTARLPGAEMPAPTGGHDPAPAGLRAGTAESLATGLSLVVCLVARLPDRILEATGIRSWELALIVVISVVAGARAVARAPFTLPRSRRAGAGPYRYGPTTSSRRWWRPSPPARS
jgi:hypothetical protein